MIDLSYKPRKAKEEDDMPLGGIILTLMPLAWLFVYLIEWGLR